MRFLMILDMPWDRNLGGPRAQMELADHLKKHGHTVEKFDLLDAYPRQTRSRLATVLPRNFANKAIKFVRDNAKRFDIIDAHQGNLPAIKSDLGFTGLLVARSVGLSPMYHESYKFSKHRWPNVPRENPVGKFLRKRNDEKVVKSIQPSLECADLINVPNQDEAEYVSKVLGLGHKCVQIPFGLTEHQHKSFATAALPAHQRLEKKKVVFIGSWGDRKGSRDWPEILTHVRRAIKGVQFLFLGTGRSAEWVMRELRSAAGEDVAIVPQFSNDDLPEILRDATVGAFPSYIEGFGIAVLEKLSSGLPTVVYDAPGPRDILKPLKRELIVPLGDVGGFAQKLVDLLSLDAMNYESLSQRCRETALQYTWSWIVETTLDNYERAYVSLMTECAPARSARIFKSKIVPGENEKKELKKIDVSIVIPNWNGKGMIEDCLLSIRRSSPNASYEVIVVDNGSTDESTEILSQDYPWVTLIRLPVNYGFASACNVGMELSHGRYIWILNSDTEIQTNTLEMMVRFMDEHPEVGALNPKVTYPDGTLQPSVLRLPSFIDTLWEEVFWHTPLHRLSKKGYKNRAYVQGVNYDDILEMEWLRGSCLFLRQEVYSKIGGFDSNFFFGFEEHDYSIRIRSAQWKLVWMPKAAIVHKASSIGPRFGKRLVIWINDGRLYFWRKYKGLPAEMCLRAIISSLQFLRVVSVSILTVFLRKNYSLDRLKTEIEILRWSLWGRPRLPEASTREIWEQIKRNEDKGSHGFILALVPTGSKIIDLACNDGTLSKQLTENGAAFLLGIERNKSAVSTARSRCDPNKSVFVAADVERLPLGPNAGSIFDAVVMADILEHIEAPAELLRTMSQMFEEAGRLRRAYVSIPNVAYWRIRLHLLRGRFEYQECGILDRTHRWFFTLTTAKQLIEKGGWSVLRMLPVPGYKGNGFRGWLSLRLANTLPQLFAPQFEFECIPNNLYIRFGEERLKPDQDFDAHTRTKQCSDL